jgi:hypothetical protein
MEATS